MSSTIITIKMIDISPKMILSLAPQSFCGGKDNASRSKNFFLESLKIFTWNAKKLYMKDPLAKVVIKRAGGFNLFYDCFVQYMRHKNQHHENFFD